MNRMPVGIPNIFYSTLYLGLINWKIVSKLIMKPFLLCLLSEKK